MGPIILVHSRIILQTRMIAVFALQISFFKAIFFKIILASSCLESCYRVGIILASSWTVAGRATPTSSSYHTSLVMLSSCTSKPLTNEAASSWCPGPRATSPLMITHHPGIILGDARGSSHHPGVILEHPGGIGAKREKTLKMQIWRVLGSIILGD